MHSKVDFKKERGGVGGVGGAAAERGGGSEGGGGWRGRKVPQR